MKAVAACLIAGVVIGCADPTGPIPGTLEVRSAPPVLELSNPGRAPIYTFTVETGTAAVINWGPCTDPSRCNSVVPGGHTAVPYASIPGYSPAATDAIVFWWHLVSGDQGSLRPDSVRAVRIRL